MSYPDHFTCSGRTFELWPLIVTNLRAFAMYYILTLGSETGEDRLSGALNINMSYFPLAVSL